MLSVLIISDVPLAGERAWRQRKTAFASRRLMCRCWSSCGHTPHTEIPWEQAPPQPERDASVQTVRCGGGLEMGVGLWRFFGFVHHRMAVSRSGGGGREGQ